MHGFCVNPHIYFCLVKLHHGLSRIEESVDTLIGPPHNIFLLNKCVVLQVSTNLAESFVFN